MDLRDRRMVLYRGSLKSCNYRCSYCPFSKHPRSERELLKDKEQWIRFCKSLVERAQQLDVRAVMVVPYGEALIHPWYWQGLGYLAAMELMEWVGAQTNLSFSAEESLELYEKAGGRREKLRLWATFHPEMTTTKEFAKKCRKLCGSGIAISAGAVGVTENLELVRSLREALPDEIYLWVNKMDGLGRRYTEEEIAGFRRIDPYFERELRVVAADPKMCVNRLFVEGDGRLRRCNISHILAENWYDPSQWRNVFDDAGGRGRAESFSCGRKSCSCYLAYGGRDEMINHIMFGRYPLFRMPEKPKAVFFDIDGTLVPKGERCMSGNMAEDIRVLGACGSRLFLATSLPYEDAKKKCGEAWHMFEGGIFDGGGHVIFESLKERKESFLYVEKAGISALEEMRGKYRFRMLTYGNKDCDGICKITLVRPRHTGWNGTEVAALEREWRKAAGEDARFYAEENCLQIVNGKASKAEGVRLICRWLGISPKEAAAVGDSPEDREMIELCSRQGRMSGPPV